MKRIISAAAVALALGTTAAFADVQTSFPDGYTIVEAVPGEVVTQGNAATLDVQTSFPDGYEVVDYSEVREANEAASGSTTTDAQAQPEFSFNYPIVS